MISFSVLRATSEQSSLCSGLFFACGIKISHPPAYLLLLIRKKARLVHLLGCKRPRNGSLSLPPFFDEAPVARGIFFGWLNHVAASLLAQPRFCIKTRLHCIGCRSLSAKSHAAPALFACKRAHKRFRLVTNFLRVYNFACLLIFFCYLLSLKMCTLRGALFVQNGEQSFYTR